MGEGVVLRSVGIHNGEFHADEVTACALLVLCDLVDRDKIVRTRDHDKLDRCEYICDVGGLYDSSRKNFDHHQSEYQGMLSSAGMMLKYLFEEDFFTEDEMVLLRDTLVHGVDLHDNGCPLESVGITTFSNVITNFNPIVYSSTREEQDAAFLEALDFTCSHLRRLLERHRYIRSYRKIVADCMNKNKDCLVFEDSIPWLDNFFELGGEDHSAKFVIMPSYQGWKLRGIPPTNDERMQVRVQLPEEWAGLLEEDLQEVSGIPGAIFCHKGRFISVWKTREGAEKAYQIVMEKNNLG